MRYRLGLALLLAACTSRTTGGGQSDSGTSGPESTDLSDPTVEPEPGTSTTFEPTTADPPSPSSSDGGSPFCSPLDYFDNTEIYSIASIIGTDSVVQEVEVLGGGPVLVAGYFGLIRRDPQDETWVILEPPEVLYQPFLQLRGGPNLEVWALAGGTAVYSVDAGDNWEVADLGGGAQIFAWDDEWLIGGEDRIGFAAGPVGPVDWIDIPALDGDTGNYQQSNIVFGLTRSDGWYIAAERFGRVARTQDPFGPWTAVDTQLGGSPELLTLPHGEIVALSSDGSVFSSLDYGSTWELVGFGSPYPEVAENATQLILTSDDLLVAASSQGWQMSCDYGRSWNIIIDHQDAITYDVSAASDGTLWAAGYDRIYHMYRY